MVLGLSALAYYPGLGGPWIYDDHANILQNTYVQLPELDLRSLGEAATSLEAGPLRRPISMISFALNYYISGGLSDTASYKSVNLALHFLNGILIFWLLQLLLERAHGLTRNWPEPWRFWLSATCAALWIAHPIQLTSVLYVVQRMTELSAMFTIAGAGTYIVGRRRILEGLPGGFAIAVLGPCSLGSLAVLSKENGALLPLFLMCIEATLFRSDRPWRNAWLSAPKWSKYAASIVCLVLVVVAAIWMARYLTTMYNIRPFTLLERLMTEFRVLVFYLSLILIPRNQDFGHVHDDISISHSLIEPWTTMPAIVIVVTLVVVGWRSRKTHPLLGLGILWFFAAHAMESTILPLEIAHEHRNYLALLGPILAMLDLVSRLQAVTQRQIVWAVLPLFLAISVTVTIQRADQWSNFASFYTYEVAHHPNSARTQAGAAVLYEAQGHPEKALQALRLASAAEPFDPGFLIQAYIVAARHGLLMTSEDQIETLRRIREGRLSAVSSLALARLGECLLTYCRSLHNEAESWIDALLGRPSAVDKSYVQYLRGRLLMAKGLPYEAIEAFRISHDLDRAYLHPLFDIARVQLAMGRTTDAQRTLVELREANRHTRHRRDLEIGQLAKDIARQASGLTSSRP